MEIIDCFVIMPFSTSTSNTEEKWTEIFEKLFKKAWNAFSIDCYKTKVPRGSITKDIIEKLYSASVVFADLTDSNPNVMYELGARHAFRKPSVMVKAKGAVIPFDVNDYTVFEYEYTPKGLEDLKEHIKTVIQDITQYPNKSDNPVWDFMNTGDFVIGQFRKTENVQKLGALNEEFASNLERCSELLETIKGIELQSGVWEEEQTPKGTTEEQRILRDGILVFYPNIRSDALTNLRVTRYANFLDEDWKTLNAIDNFYSWCQVCSSNMGVYSMDEVDKKKIIKIQEKIKEGMEIVNKRIQELLELK